MSKITFAQSTALGLILSLSTFNQAAFASKRVAPESIEHETVKKLRSSTADDKLSLVSVKIEGEQKVAPHVMTIEDIQQRISKFNPRNGRFNCLACSVSFLRWIQSQGHTLEGARTLKPKSYNITYTGDTGKLIDHANGERIPYYPASFVIGDNTYTEEVELDSQDSPKEIKFDMFSLASLKNTIEALPLKEGLDYQYGILFLDHINSANTGHFLNFYRYKSNDGSIFSYIIDVQTREIQTIDNFLERYLNDYKASAYVWWDRSASSLKNAVEVKQEITAPHSNVITNNSAGTMPTGREADDVLLMKTLESPAAPQADKDEAAYKLAALKIQGKTTLITDEQAAGYLMQAIKSTTMIQTMKDDSAYKLAKLKALGCTTLITNDQAAGSLIQLLTNSTTTQALKDSSAYLLAMMKSLGRTTVVTYEQAAGHLIKLLTNSTMPQDLKDNAAYNLAVMKAQGRTTLITDDQAAGYLIQTLNRQNISQGLKDDAAYRLAVMKAQGRTTLITDDQAAGYFIQALTNSTTTQAQKDAAAYRLATLKLHGSTTLITDEQAAGYLIQNLNSPTTTQAVKDDAAYHLANMKAQRRTTLITKEEALKYFEQALNRQNISQDLK